MQSVNHLEDRVDQSMLALRDLERRMVDGTEGRSEQLDADQADRRLQPLKLATKIERA